MGSKDNRRDFEKQEIREYVEEVRRRVRSEYVDDVTDNELIQYFLNIDSPYKDYTELSEQLLNQYSNVKRLITSDIYELCNTKGLTESKAVLFWILPDLVSIVFGKPEYYARNIDELIESFNGKLPIPRTDTFWVFCYDEKTKLIDFFNFPYSRLYGKMMKDQTIFYKIMERNPRYIAFYYIGIGYRDATKRMRNFLLSIYKNIETLGLNILDGCVLVNEEIYSVFTDLKNPYNYNNLSEQEKDLSHHYSPIFDNY